MAAGIKRDVRKALAYVDKLIADSSVDKFHAPGAPNYASALAFEGYNGGYADALRDVLLALNYVIPNRWLDWQIEKYRQERAK